MDAVCAAQGKSLDTSGEAAEEEQPLQVRRRDSTECRGLELDRKNGNNLWRDAISAEIGTLTDMKVFKILEHGVKAPSEYKMIPMWIIFDVKIEPSVVRHDW